MSLILASLPFWEANIGGKFLPCALPPVPDRLKVGGCKPEEAPALGANEDWRAGCGGGGEGFFLESLNYSNVPRSATFFLFLPAMAGLLDCFSRWMVLPDFWDRYGMDDNSFCQASVILIDCFWVSGACAVQRILLACPIICCR